MVGWRCMYSPDFGSGRFSLFGLFLGLWLEKANMRSADCDAGAWWPQGTGRMCVTGLVGSPKRCAADNSGRTADVWRSLHFRCRMHDCTTNSLRTKSLQDHQISLDCSQAGNVLRMYYLFSGACIAYMRTQTAGSMLTNQQYGIDMPLKK